MKRLSVLLSVILLCLVGLSPANAAPLPVGGPAGKWAMTFNDEFSNSKLNTAKWSNCWFPPGCGGVGPGEKTSPANVSVRNGQLNLTLSNQTTGALVSTNVWGGAKPGYEFKTGYVEARINFPGGSNGCYNWPAFWLNGKVWPNDGENDIAEVLGGQMTVNYHSPSGAHNQGAVPGRWCGGYHTYGLHRQVGKADVYYDGKLVKSYTTDDTGEPGYIILSVGSGGYAPLARYGSASTVKVDYVRVWQ